MQVKVKPVFAIGGGPILLPQPDGVLDCVSDSEAIVSRIEALSEQLKHRLGSKATLMEPTVLRREGDFFKLRKDALEADAFLLYLLGHIALERLFEYGLYVIAFGGEYAPTQALYAFSTEERESRPNVAVALDYKEIEDQIRFLGVRKRLRNARIAHIGYPVRTFSNWQEFPDPELMRHKLGVDLTLVEPVEYYAELSRIEDTKAEAIAREWMANAQEIVEPSPADVTEAAKVYLAIGNILERTGANAVAFSCSELILYTFARQGGPPPCMAVAMLRDNGIPAGCEGDVSALLTSMILDYIAGKPAFMGNIVRADPESNLVMVSHDTIPCRMAGTAEPPLPYKLRDFAFSEHGVCPYVDLEIGQEATVARIASNLDRLVAVSAEIVGCRDTVASRATVTVRVRDAREFFHKATGNHHVLVYGNHMAELRGVCQMLGISLIEL